MKSAYERRPAPLVGTPTLVWGYEFGPERGWVLLLKWPDGFETARFTVPELPQLRGWHESDVTATARRWIEDEVRPRALAAVTEACARLFRARQWSPSELDAWQLEKSARLASVFDSPAVKQWDAFLRDALPKPKPVRPLPPSADELREQALREAYAQAVELGTWPDLPSSDPESDEPPS